MTPPAAIVFDFDGTITDTEWPAYEVWREVFRAHGHEITLEAWVQTIGRADNRPLAQALADTFGDDVDEELVAAAQARRQAATDRAGVREGVIEVIEAAVGRGLPLAIASSSPLGWVEHHLRRLDLLHHFPVIRARDHVQQGKPAPDLFLAAAAALDVDPAAALAIEDSRHGCAAAKAAGMTCVVVPNRITTIDRPPDADLILESLSHFPFARFGLA